MYGFDEILFAAVHDFEQVMVISTHTEIAKRPILKSGPLGFFGFFFKNIYI